MMLNEPRQIITKVSRGKFRIHWDGIPNSAIDLDFNPIIKALGLTGSFILRHWQAKPWGLRRFGYYDGETDTYTSHLGGDFPTGYDWGEVQLDETTIKTKPIAVILGVRTNEERA